MRKMILLATLLLFAGCTMKFDAKINTADIAIPKAEEKIPAAVGIYHSPELKAYVHKELWMGEHFFIYKIGEETAAYFERLYSNSFADTEVVQSRPPLASHQKPLSAVIETRIEKADVDIPSPMGGDIIHKALLSCRFVLFRMDGDPMASWVISETGTSKEHFGTSKYETSGEAVRSAIAKIGNRFQKSWTGWASLAKSERSPSSESSTKALDSQTTNQKESISITATPLLDAARQTKQFGAVLTTEGILPVKIAIRDGTPVALRFRGWDSLMVGQEGRANAPLSPDLASARMLQTSSTGPVSAALFGAFVGIMAASAEHDSLKEEQQKQAELYRNSGLWERDVNPGDRVEGFLFFDLPKSKTPTFRYRLMLRLFDETNRKTLSYNVPVEGKIMDSEGEE